MKGKKKKKNNKKQVMQKQSLTTSSPMPSQSLSSGYLGKHSPSQFLLLSMLLCGMEYLLGQFGSAFLVVSPASLLAGGRQNEKPRRP